MIRSAMMTNLIIAVRPKVAVHISIMTGMAHVLVRRNVAAEAAKQAKVAIYPINAASRVRPWGSLSIFCLLESR